MTVSPKNLYGFVSVAEMVTWTGLIAAMVARYGFDHDGPWFFVAGISHGSVFLAYVTVTVLVSHNQRWSPWRTFVALVAAIPPYLTVPVDRSLLNRGLLEGNWRTEPGNDPRDQRFPDPLYRWFIARPILLVVTILVILSVILSVLLALGSPTEWGQSD